MGTNCNNMQSLRYMTDRYVEIKKLYTDVFTGKENYMPLIACPPCPMAPGHDDFWEDIQSAVNKAVTAYHPRIEVGSDWLATVNTGLYQCIAIPSLFGAEVLKVKNSEPICKRCFNSVKDANDFKTPRIEGAVIEKLFKDIQSAKTALPENFYLSFPVTASPFDLAQLMVGENFLIDLLENQEQCLSFLSTLAGLSIELIRMTKKELGLSRKEFITNRGLFFPGLRLPCDAIVNYSPEIIRNIVLPILGQFRDALGPLCIHFCTEPAPSGHVLEILLESDDVIAVDNWQGPDVFIGKDAPVPLQSEISIISSMDLSSKEKIDAFFAREPIIEVPRKGGRGIVLATEVESVETGKDLYRYWRRKQGF